MCNLRVVLKFLCLRLIDNYKATLLFSQPLLTVFLIPSDKIPFTFVSASKFTQQVLIRVKLQPELF